MAANATKSNRLQEISEAYSGLVAYWFFLNAARWKINISYTRKTWLEEKKKFLRADMVFGIQVNEFFLKKIVFRLVL